MLPVIGLVKLRTLFNKNTTLLMVMLCILSAVLCFYLIQVRAKYREVTTQLKATQSALQQANAKLVAIELQSAILKQRASDAFVQLEQTNNALQQQVDVNNQQYRQRFNEARNAPATSTDAAAAIDDLKQHASQSRWKEYNREGSD